MRVWDYPPKLLCNRHLLAQHNEIHAIHSIITNGKIGFSNHPEVNRWRGHLGALYRKHERTVAEMLNRGMNHHTPIKPKLLFWLDRMPEPWQSKAEQFKVLVEKQKQFFWCDCAERILFKVR